jgi:pimeloyl-ACP methyl ester carboxylesterase
MGDAAGMGTADAAGPGAPAPARSSAADVTVTSAWIDLDGPTHYVEVVGTAGPQAPVAVCVHGLAGAHTNWLGLARRLSSTYRVLALDLPGHGLTRAGLRDARVDAHRRLLHRFLVEVTDGPVLLVGNSMGGLLALREAAAAPDRVSALVLVAAAVPTGRARLHPVVAAGFAGYAVPGIGELVVSTRLRRFSPEQLVAQSLWMCCGDASRVPPEVVAEHVALVRARAGHRRVDAAFLASARSLLRALARGGAFRADAAAVRAPVLMIQGDRDRLVPVAAARATAARFPAWTYHELAGVGHVPMMEVPDETEALIRAWLDGLAGAGA